MSGFLSASGYRGAQTAFSEVELTRTLFVPCTSRVVTDHRQTVVALRAPA